jgi:DNA-3-methyladenine glycosylase I
MAGMTTYCEYCNTHPEDTFNKTYHDTEYGFPLKDDDLLFERLILEINQAGLSWITILKKAENFRKAYDGFAIDVVAAYKAKDVQRLLNNAGIIRNRLKINAAIENAKRIAVIRSEYGSFKGWLDHHARSGLSKAEWIKLFRQTFVFTGGEIVNEFLMSTGYLPGAHTEDCPVYAKALKKKPAWTR